MIFVVLLVFGFSFNSAHAATGLDYLSAQQNPDGSFGNTATSLATPVQTTTETLSAYQILGQQNLPAYTSALAYLNGDPEANTEFLARKILVNAKAGNDVTVLINTLITNQNTDGGFGNQAGDSSSVLDTAYALEALASANYASGTLVSSAAGYLLSRQQSDGGWKEGDNVTSVFLTAQAVRALTPYRNTYQGISGAIQSAQNYLLSQRVNGLWAEPHDTALALIALLPIADRTLLSSSIAGLNAQQQSNGSWTDDPYTTALALRVLALAATPAPDPDLGILRGRVVDAATGTALANVSVALSGTSAASAATGVDGVFQFNNLAPGSYSLSLSLAGYATVNTQTMVSANAIKDLGTISLVKSTTATTGTVHGVVTDALTNQPIAGAAVTATGALPAVTDASGAYQIANVPAGAVTLTASKAGYATATGAATMTAGTVLVFSPALNAQTGTVTIQGRVVDAETALPLSNVTVSLSGPVQPTFTTSADGVFSFTGLPSGSYSLNTSATGFFSLFASLFASSGDLNTGDLALSREAPAGTGTVRGTVTDAQTGQPLAGASVSVGGNTATTDASGAYTIANLAPGDVVVQAARSGYVSVAGSGQLVAGGVLVFSPALTPQAGQQTGLQGTVTDGATGQPLAGVVVSVTGGSTATATTDAQGKYLISLSPGAFLVTASQSGYDTVSASGTAVSGSTISFSPLLYPANTTPPDANAAGAQGIVLDAGTNQPIAGATVTASYQGTIRSALTDGSGLFSFAGIPGGEISLSVSVSGYVGATLGFTLEPLEILDVGQIRLRKETVAVLLPDFTINVVNGGNAINDPRTLALAGNLAVTVANIGTANAPAGIRLTAFYDANKNGRLDATDPVLGETTLGTMLDVGGNTSVTIPVRGALPFRDAPIHVFADSALTAAELDEGNNVGSTAALCQVEPQPSGALSLKLKWHWPGPNDDQTRRDVYGPMAVARILDTNGDGNINETDIPVLVFGASINPTESRGSVLVAVRGDGTELWRVGGFNVTHRGSAAIADLDGDGKPDIVISNHNRSELFAFNNDGTLKWRAPSGPTYTTGTGVSDGIAIADLDHDGAPEVIQGNRVFNADGSLRWVGTGDRGGPNDSTFDRWGYVPIAADVMLSGTMQVIAGRTVYDAGGNILWHRGDLPGDGVNAVGNFDADTNPEIVLVTRGRVYLLQHTGETIWGPVSIPGGGRGGPPTIADFDGDGSPDIGVAGRTRYMVLNADGSIKWSIPVQDLSSNATGSSVFDFQGDGKAEVLYSDETTFHIMDGASGQIVASVPNTSGTTLEYPNVVDVDNDGHADVVLPGNRFGTNQTPGLRVFESADQPWVATRTIWNQHSYHIDNINEDGSVPRDERPSWLSHNTYRLNAFPDRSALAVPDLTASLLRIVDRGYGQGIALSVRIGNAGTAVPSADVAFYDGDPAAGGVLLGTLVVNNVPAAGYQDVVFNTNSIPAGTRDLYAVVDRDNRIIECREDNNVANIAPVAGLVGEITVSTDNIVYGPESSVLLHATVANTGYLTTGFTAQLFVEDSQGVLVKSFPPHAVNGLASLAIADIVDQWDTGLSLAGSYRLRGELRDVFGGIVDESVSTFEIQPCSAPTVNMLITPVSIPGDNTANLTPVLRFKFEGNGELVPLSSIPPSPASLVNDPIYSAFSPKNELFIANRHGNVRGFPGTIARFTFDSDGNFIPNGVVSGNSLEAVHGVAFSPDGELFAGGLHSGLISRFKFDAAGNAIPNGTFYSGNPHAQGLAFSSGGELFVTDSFGANAPYVQRWRFDPMTGAPIHNGSILLPGAVNPHGLAFSSKGELFIGDIGNGRIYRFLFDALGNPVANGLVSVTAPIGIAFSSTGEMLVTSHGPGGIRRFVFDQQGNAIPNGVVATQSLGGISIKPVLRGAQSQCVALASTQVTTDKPVYEAWDFVAISGRVTNNSLNTILAPAQVEFTVRAPGGAVLLTETRSVAEMVPGSLRDISIPMLLADAVTGSYPVEMVLMDAATGSVLSTSTTSFQVQRREVQALTGEVTVSAPLIQQGDAGVCTEVAKNISGGTLSSVLLIHQLIHVDSGTVVSEVTETVNLAAGGIVHNYFRNFDTAGLALGGYSCVIKAEINGETKTLAFGGFRLVEPPIKVTADLRLGSKGRLLVMLDHAGKNPDPAVADSDPFGPGAAPGLTAQRAFLEKILKKAGWSYTITDTAEDFTRELRTSSYSVYALFTEQEKLAEQVQKELREAVFRGEGLLEAGSHDQRQGRVDEALGIKYMGQFNNVAMLELMPSPLHAGGQEAFLFDDKELRAELAGAQSTGHYLGGSGDLRDAVTYHEYGAGKSVYAGFDLLVQATAAGEQSLFTALLLNSLNYIHPASLTPISGAVIPVDIVLTNQGIAAQVKVQLALPAGTTLADAGTAQVADGVMTWETVLAVGESKTLTFWIKLPAPAGQFTLVAKVFAGVNNQSISLVAEPNMTLPVNDPESLTSVMNRIDTLLSNQNPNSQSLKQARKFIEKALGNFHPALAIDELLKATDCLLDIADPDVVTVRVAIGQWIRWASPYAY